MGELVLFARFWKDALPRYVEAIRARICGTRNLRRRQS